MKAPSHKIRHVLYDSIDTNIWKKLTYRLKVDSVFLRVEEMKGLGGDN